MRAILVVLTLALMAPPALAQKRVALLIGNKGYSQAVGSLVNPHNDVELVGKALRDVGFELMPIIKDATREQLLLAVHDFAERLKVAGEGAVGFLYYSGHGAAVGNQNYLIPVDVDQTSSRVVTVKGVSHAEVLKALEDTAPNAAHYLVLDACRNNLGGVRGGKGFVAEARRSNFLIAFSAAPGTTASDEGIGSGPYASALAAELVKRGQDDLNMFHNIRVAVDQKTGGDQLPWIEDGIRMPSRLVFGGSQRVARWPWVAALRLHDAMSKLSLYYCQGTVIAQNWILTAAHCVGELAAKNALVATIETDKGKALSKLEVVIGVDDLRDVGTNDGRLSG